MAQKPTLLMNQSSSKYFPDCPDRIIIDLPSITRINIKGQKDVEKIHLKWPKGIVLTPKLSFFVSSQPNNIFIFGSSPIILVMVASSGNT